MGEDVHTGYLQNYLALKPSYQLNERKKLESIHSKFF
jgi:hypothetical protein